MQQKPVAESCLENQQVIFEQLETLFSDRKSVLEIGSGTGQHAVYFSQRLSGINWQPSDLYENIEGMKLWFDEAALSNINEPLVLDVADTIWPLDKLYDAAFTANSMHIMSVYHVEKMFSGLGNVLEQDAIFASYGPYNYGGKYTSESNARFDLWLKARDPLSGIRDIDELTCFAELAGMSLIDDIEMPVNNRLLVWKKTGSEPYA